MTDMNGGQIDQLLTSFDRDAALNFTQKRLKTVYKAVAKTLILVFTIINIVVLFVINFVFESRFFPDAAQRAGQSFGSVTVNPENGTEGAEGTAPPPAGFETEPGFSIIEDKFVPLEDLAGELAESADDFEQFSGDTAGESGDLGAAIGEDGTAFADGGLPPGEGAEGIPADGETALGETAPRSVIEKDGNLLRHESEGDVFAVLSTWKGLLNTAVGNELFFVTNKYDTYLRLASRAEWQKAENAAGHETVRLAVYFYADTVSKTAQARDVYSYTDNTHERTEYDNNGNPLRVIITRGKEKSEIVSEVKYVYDSQRRVIEKTSRWFSLSGAEQKEKARYEYTGKAQTPDIYIYQNDALSYSAVYDSEKNYTETRVLTEDYSVSTRYENDELVREIYMFNGTELRRREY